MVNSKNEQGFKIFDLGSDLYNEKLQQINLNAESEKLRFFEKHLRELQNWAEENAWNYTAYFLEKAQESLITLDGFSKIEKNDKI